MIGRVVCGNKNLQNSRFLNQKGRNNHHQQVDKKNQKPGRPYKPAERTETKRDWFMDIKYNSLNLQPCGKNVLWFDETKIQLLAFVKALFGAKPVQSIIRGAT